jgi:hypothetical protein
LGFGILIALVVLLVVVTCRVVRTPFSDTTSEAQSFKAVLHVSGAQSSANDSLVPSVHLPDQFAS